MHVLKIRYHDERCNEYLVESAIVLLALWENLPFELFDQLGLEILDV
jgi:hypothetical protein